MSVAVAIGTGVAVAVAGITAVWLAVAVAGTGAAVEVLVRVAVGWRMRMARTTICRSLTSTSPSWSTSALVQSTSCGFRPRHCPTIATSIADTIPSPLTSGDGAPTAASPGRVVDTSSRQIAASAEMHKHMRGTIFPPNYGGHRPRYEPAAARL
jgi:hypothetical protein